MIYIREAHPVDGWWFGKGPFKWILKLKGSKAALDVHDPKTTTERTKVAQRCADTLAYGIPTLVDAIDDAVNQQYAALPTRLYLVGLDGKVVYAAGPGPWGFKPPQLERAIQVYLDKNPVSTR
jgi:hypothetical protein